MDLSKDSMLCNCSGSLKSIGSLSMSTGRRAFSAVSAMLSVPEWPEGSSSLSVVFSERRKENSPKCCYVSCIVEQASIVVNVNLSK